MQPILDFVLETLRAVRAEDSAWSRTAAREVELGPDTPLVGEGAVLNSHGFVAFILDLEAGLEERWGLVGVDLLANEVLARHPYRTVGTTAELLEGLIDGS